MKKYIACLLAVLLLVTMFAGCSKTVETELEGSWQGKLSFAVLLQDQLKEDSLKALISQLDLSSTEITVTITFRNDGTYALSMDLESLTELLTKLKAGIQDLSIPQEIQQKLQEQGLDVDTLLTTIKTLFSGETKAATIQGSFRTENNKLYLSIIKGVGLYSDSSTAYKVESNTLTLESFSGSSLDVMQLLAPFFPLALEKLS